jgi:hypothetical protein
LLNKRPTSKEKSSFSLKPLSTRKQMCLNPMSLEPRPFYSSVSTD